MRTLLPTLLLIPALLAQIDSVCTQNCTMPLVCGCTTPVDLKPEWQLIIEWVLIVLLVLLSGLFSGLNLGLMSLDLTGLEIIAKGDPLSSEAGYARTIMPVRKYHNWLLCTLLFGNVAVNAALSILLSAYTDGATGFVLSTAIIVVFGEIIPQAIVRLVGE